MEAKTQYPRVKRCVSTTRGVNQNWQICCCGLFSYLLEESHFSEEGTIAEGDDVLLLRMCEGVGVGIRRHIDAHSASANEEHRCRRLSLTKVNEDFMFSSLKMVTGTRGGWATPTGNEEPLIENVSVKTTQSWRKKTVQRRKSRHR